MFLLSLYQHKTTKNYQNFLTMDLKDQCIETNLKQKVRIKVRQTKPTNYVLLTYSLIIFWFLSNVIEKC